MVRFFFCFMFVTDAVFSPKEKTLIMYLAWSPTTTYSIWSTTRELLYSPEDDTRASPFFWAFRKAYPQNSDQIFSITDSIPAPIKEVGPAFQQIDFSTSSQTGNFISRVKVATLGGLATSMMTTRGLIVGCDGLDGLRLKVETTKPEDSTIINTLFGPLGKTINESAPPFPSGDALERVQPGSSEVVMRTTFCDDTLRISRNDDRPNDVFFGSAIVLLPLNQCRSCATDQIHTTLLNN